MTSDKKIDLEQAYAVETPDDNIRLYADWAETYDSDFVAANGYVSHLRVAEQLIGHLSEMNGALLDVGCGTGIVGLVLRSNGFSVVDGLDISTQMLAEAGRKKTDDGEDVYRNLIQADLTQQVSIGSDSYAGLVSAGTFTHGHLGPESLDELWRIAAPGAICSIGINADHYDSKGFREKIAMDVDRQVISNPEFIEVDAYASLNVEEGAVNQKAIIIVCRVI